MRRKYGLYGRVGPARGFTWGEVRCTDGTLPTDRAFRRRVVKQARTLNRLRGKVRKHYGGRRRVAKVTILVNSWYRSPEYNASIWGAEDSQHLYGRATDINVNVTYRDGRGFRLRTRTLAAIARRVPRFRRGGIGLYPNFVHVDTRGYKARW